MNKDINNKPEFPDSVINELDFDGTRSKYKKEMENAYNQDLEQKILRINADKFRNYMHEYENNKKIKISHLREPGILFITFLIAILK